MNAIPMLESCARHQQGDVPGLPRCQRCTNITSLAFYDGIRLCWPCAQERRVELERDRLWLMREGMR